MTEFSKNELLRLVDKIPETDPTTTAYHVLMQSIECYNSLALTVDEIIALRDEDAYDDLMEQLGLVKQQAEKIKEIVQDNVVPFTAPDFPESAAEEDDPPLTGEGGPAHAPKEEKTYDAPTVRKALLDARARGVNVKELLRGFGADGFQGVPAEKYGALMDALRAV